jgi:CRISPR/Cas system-associated endonuclease/helicase Cas3
MNDSSQLSPTQELVLRNAAKRGGSVMPLPENLKGGAAKKVCESLENKGFINGLPTDEDSDPTLCQITPAGYEAIGEVEEDNETASTSSYEEEKEEAANESEAAGVDDKVGFKLIDNKQEDDAESDVPTEAEEEVENIVTNNADDTEESVEAE